mmetsp:Transcript_77201/g.153095  ORF Transcript_77201/g.153095 Transcript_77201/m.153095 type:complete len:338 (+) Transcript_77201:90-1103(+)
MVVAAKSEAAVDMNDKLPSQPLKTPLMSMVDAYTGNGKNCGHRVKRHCKCWPRRPSPPRLGSAEEANELARRPFIEKYYRLEKPRYAHFCCCHNELGNMWTHILAAMVLAYKVTSFATRFAIVDGGGRNASTMTWPFSAYRALIGVFFVVAVATFSVSVQYHWKLCSNHQEVVRWICLDQTSCLVLLAAGFIAGIPLGYHCYPWLLTWYTVQSLSALGVTVAVIMLCPEESGAWRALAVIAFGISSLVPMLHWLVISTEGRRIAGTSLEMGAVAAVVAVVCYTQYIPERFAPGWFDLYFNSHQIWHVLIFAATVIYGDVLVRVFDSTMAGDMCFSVS